MLIGEMHEVFRTLGQQMGMQTIRAILPESIDIYLNNQIINTVRNIVRENVTTVYNDKVAVQDNAISPINSIKTLYDKNHVPILEGDGSRLFPFKGIIEFDYNVMYYTSVIVYYGSTKSFKCRLIEGDKLEDTINDYCNSASWDAPVAEIIVNNAVPKVEIYTEQNKHNIENVLIRYIKKPAKVKFSMDDSSNVNCDLPEYLHPDIVAAAVNEFFRSVGSTSQNID